MKKIFFNITFAVFFLIFTSAVYAATPTPTSTETKAEKLESQINELKERVASRVAELKLVEKRGIIIKVTEASSTQIQGEDINGNIRFVDVDEFTEFSSGSIDSFGISDIEEGDTLGVLGLYNKNSNRILARFVNTMSFENRFYGSVSNVNKEDFYIVVAGSDNVSTTVDIEKTTETTKFTKEDALEKSGFSEIEPGQRVIVTGFEDKSDAKRIIAERVIIFLDIPLDSKYALSLQDSGQ